MTHAENRPGNDTYSSRTYRQNVDRETRRESTRTQLLTAAIHSMLNDRSDTGILSG